MYELQVDATWGAGQRLNNAMVYNDTAILRGDAEVAALILKLSAQAPEPYQPAIANLIAELGINESPTVPVPPAPPPPVVDEPSTGLTEAEVRRIIAEEVAKVSASGVVPITSGNGDAGLQITAGSVTHRLYAGSEDYGLRLWFNYREPYVNGSSYSIPTLPQMALFFEQDGAASLSYFKPQTSAIGQYDKLGGKALLFRGGGWSDTGQRDKNVSVYSGQVGRGLQLGVCSSKPNYPDRFDIQIDPQSNDPVSITVDGQLRRVKMRPDGSLYAE